MAGKTPSISSIPAGLPFARTLAAELLNRSKDNPASLSDMLILLPTRRACRVLQEAFAELKTGNALILPRMQPIGDLDEEELALSLIATGREDLADQIKPELSPLRRQIALTSLVQKFRPDDPPDQALSLARLLGQLMDQIHTEGLDLKDLPTLVEDSQLAAHWQITTEFLKILSEHWPQHLAEQGCIDRAERRNLLIGALCAHWRAHPPAYPVIAAGSTGSIPAVAQLLGLVSHLPNGELILPGLDTDMDEASWDALSETHPQYNLKHLLQVAGAARADVMLWPDEQKISQARRALAAEIMRPAATASAWQNLAEDASAQHKIKAALENLSLIPCENEREEAEVIALLLRGALEVPNKTACLITPDRTLAARVQQACTRWGITLDDSAGQILSDTALGSFLILSLEAALEQFAPVKLMALCKHAYFQIGHDLGELTAAIEILDYALRGPKPAPGLSALKDHIAAHHKLSEQEQAKALALIEKLETPYGPLCTLISGSSAIHPAQGLRTVLKLCEELTHAPNMPGPQRLWSGPAGNAASNFFSGLLPEAGALPELTGVHKGRELLGILAHFMTQVQIRTPYGVHPRLRILGQIEARMINADLVIMGGLNEGTWPPEAPVDPWMSRPMRRAFGLPSAERGTGLAAHDFVQAFCRPEVVMMRARRKDGAPTTPARWLLRLEAVLQAAGFEISQIENHDLPHWARAIDAAELHAPIKRPAPKPDLAKRPREISLTDVETWLKDPYAIYAKYILGLKKLYSLEEDLDAAERGTLLHNILQRFVERTKTALPENAQEILQQIAQEELANRHEDEALWSFWWPRFMRVADWLANHEQQWRAEAAPEKPEAKGRLNLDGPAGPFTIIGRADRIDRFVAGGYALIDYKSGGQFSKKAIENGDKPQLAIEALMLQSGGFEDVPAGKARAVQYWVLSGTGPGGKVVNFEDGLDQALSNTQEGLTRLIANFDDPETRYTCLPHPGKAPDYNDYEHLARIKEWSMDEESEQIWEDSA